MKTNKDTINRCFISKKLEMPKCSKHVTESINPEYHKIQLYLSQIQQPGFFSDSQNEVVENTNKIIDAVEDILEDKKISLEQDLQGANTTREKGVIAEDIKTVVKLTKQISNVNIPPIKDTQNIKLSNHIYDFIEDLLLYTNITYEKLKEIFRGAFVIIRGDKKSFYEKYNNVKYIYQIAKLSDGTTSHKSGEENQLRLGAGDLISCGDVCKKTSNFFDLLVGTTDESHSYDKGDSSSDTWFQFEYAKNDTENKDKHFISTIVHLQTYRNVGPFGTSKYTDKTKKYLDLDVCDSTNSDVCDSANSSKKSDLISCIPTVYKDDGFTPTQDGDREVKISKNPINFVRLIMNLAEAGTNLATAWIVKKMEKRKQEEEEEDEFSFRGFS